jgi:hypothetical protein
MKWDPNALWLKAKSYADRGHSASEGDLEFPLYCALSLEFLARAALASVHPALLAKPDDDGVSLFYALGLPTKRQPQSVEMKTVHARLANIIPEFAEGHQKFCEQMAYWRNEELHTGGLPFEEVKESEWLPRFYAAAKCLCVKLGKSLEDYVGEEQTEVAEQLIEAAAKKRISAVKKSIAAHAEVFMAKPEEERTTLLEASKKIAPGEYVSAGRNHSLTLDRCPACGGSARKIGRLVHETVPVVVDSQLESTQTFLAGSLACPACGLKLGSPEDLHIAGCEPRFFETGTFDPRDYFQFEGGDDPYMNM